MDIATTQRALMALQLLLTRDVSMTAATKLARTTPKTLKTYLALQGIKWSIRKGRFRIDKTAEQKRFEFLNLMLDGVSATKAARELETTVKTMSQQTLNDASGTAQPIIEKSGGSWKPSFVKVEDYSIVYYGSIEGLDGNKLGRGVQEGPTAKTEEGEEDYMDIWWQVDFESWKSTLPASSVAEFWKPQVMQVLRTKLESLVVSDPALATDFLTNTKVSAHATAVGRLSRTGMPVSRLEQILRRYEAKMTSSVSSGVDDNMIFRPPSYVFKSDLATEISQGAFQVMFLNKDEVLSYPVRPEMVSVEHNLNDESV